jgi:hypothetical protein
VGHSTLLSKSPLRATLFVNRPVDEHPQTELNQMSRE